MTAYIILTKVSPQAMEAPEDFKVLAERVSHKIKEECPAVHWKESYATLGRFDVVDIVESEDQAQVERAAMIIRAQGHSTTETMVATSWKEFLSNL